MYLLNENVYGICKECNHELKEELAGGKKPISAYFNLPKEIHLIHDPILDRVITEALQDNDWEFDEHLQSLEDNH